MLPSRSTALNSAAMCNLYTMTKAAADDADLFGAIAEPPDSAGDAATICPWLTTDRYG